MDLTGTRYGRLVVQSRHHENAPSRSIQWLCVCDCGGTKIVPADYLRSGRTQSCGCLQRENRESLSAPIKHGMRNTSEYMTWIGMRQRCNNPKNVHYPDYGGRGIKVCPEWDESFENFHRDMGNKPSPELTLEREENSKGYSPDNCKWATKKEQANNRRSSLELSLNGEKVNVSELSSRSGVSVATIRKRLIRGDSVERAIRPLNSKDKD